MAAPFLPQAQIQAPRNAMLDFSPINNAIDSNRRNAMLQQQQDVQREELGMRREEHGMRQRQFDQQAQQQIRQRFGALAQVVDQEQDPNLRAQRWQQVLRLHPGAGSLDASFRDPAQGPKLLMAEAGIVIDPLERQIKQAQLGQIGAQTDQARAHAGLFRRQANAPTKEEAEVAEAARLKAQTARNIEGGLGELSQLPGTYGGDSGTFGSAVGQFRGADNGLILGPLGRAWGSFTSFVGNTAGSPAEVRSQIRGHATALAATLKPLIRKPGEGAWSDRDQALLDNIVGDLTTANNEAEYRRRLEGVRQRVIANFGIELAPLPGGGVSGTRPAAGANNVSNMSDDELLKILGAP